jgi:arsenate reductase-like glutaredoxin family protein
LRNSGVEVEEVDYGKVGLTQAAVEEIVELAGGVAKVMNTRHATVMEKGWVAKPPAASTFAKAVVADVNLLKRPILIDGESIIIGFDKPAYAKLGK